MKFKYTLFILFLVVALISSISVGYIFYNANIDTLSSWVLYEMDMELSSSKEHVNNLLKEAESDVLFLSELSDLKNLINFQDEAARDLAKLELQQDFLAFSKKREMYYQIRYIDENGQEIIRVDSDGVTSRIISEDELQNKKGRYYFEDAMSARAGRVFVSPLDLNIEHGEIENRGTEEEPIYVPVIRYATPVFDNENNPKGIVIMNVYGNHVIQGVHELQEGGITKLFLVNKEGFYLHHFDTKKEFGFMFENDETIYRDYPLAAALLSSQGSKEPLKKGNLIVAFDRIYPSGKESLSSTGSNKAYTKSISRTQGKDNFWVLISIAQQEDVFAPLIVLRNEFLIIIVLTTLIVIVTSFYVSHMITEPIHKLHKATEIFEEGKLDYRIKTKTKEGMKPKDEIDQLSRAFNKMAAGLESKSKEAQKELIKREKSEDEIKKQVEELEKVHKLTIGRELRMVELKKRIKELEGRK